MIRPCEPELRTTPSGWLAELRVGQWINEGCVTSIVRCDGLIVHVGMRGQIGPDGYASHYGCRLVPLGPDGRVGMEDVGPVRRYYIGKGMS